MHRNLCAFSTVAFLFTFIINPFWILGRCKNEKESFYYPSVCEKI